MADRGQEGLPGGERVFGGLGSGAERVLPLHTLAEVVPHHQVRGTARELHPAEKDLHGELVTRGRLVHPEEPVSAALLGDAVHFLGFLTGEATVRLPLRRELRGVAVQERDLVA